MTDAEVYVKAAKMLEDGHQRYPCVAVGLVTNNNAGAWIQRDTLAGRFILTMAPGKRERRTTREASHAYIFANGLYDGHSILALCFMAAITASSR